MFCVLIMSNFSLSVTLRREYLNEPDFTVEFNAPFGPTRIRPKYSSHSTYEPRRHSPQTDVQTFPHLPRGEGEVLA